MFKIFIGNVSFKTTEENLRDIFAPHITIEDLVIARDPKTGRSMGYGFVMTRDKDKGREAIRRIGKVLIHDRRIYLKESRDKKAKAPAGFGAGSRPMRPRRPRPPMGQGGQGQGGQGGFNPRPPFPQRRPMSGQPGGTPFRSQPPRAHPQGLPHERLNSPKPPPQTPPIIAPGGYVGLNDTPPANNPPPHDED